jgi:hypothetical protein
VHRQASLSPLLFPCKHWARSARAAGSTMTLFADSARHGDTGTGTAKSSLVVPLSDDVIFLAVLSA